RARVGPHRMSILRYRVDSSSQGTRVGPRRTSILRDRVVSSSQRARVGPHRMSILRDRVVSDSQGPGRAPPHVYFEGPFRVELSGARVGPRRTSI
ncbi:hypothetical protein J6590_070070, partial [Homalodisca vitripennis]